MTEKELNEKIVILTHEALILKYIIAVLFVGVAVLCFIAKEKSELISKFEREKSELLTKVNLQNVEIETSKSNLKEAHEWLDVAFNDGSDILNKYNELKKKCKGKK